MTAILPAIPMGARIAFLFGAGASFGYTLPTNSNPPLGRDLFSALAASPLCPAWQTPEIAALFAKHPGDFETPMATLCGVSAYDPWPVAKNDERLFELVHELCHFLVQFVPPANRTNFYATVINLLIARGRLQQTLLCSLNYECLLEETLVICKGRTDLIWQFGGQCEFPLRAPTILKIHGSANFFPAGGDIRNVSVIGGGKAYTGGTGAREPGPALRAYYDEGMRWPFICHYAPGKPAHLQNELRNLPFVWQHWVQAADAVIVIGANASVPDWHIWEPLRRSNAQVYYAGGDGTRLASAIGNRYHF